MKRPTLDLINVTAVRSKLAEILGASKTSTDATYVGDDCILGENSSNVSAENRARANLLSRLLKEPTRPMVVASRRMEQHLEKLKRDMPHFAAVTEILLGKAAVSIKTGSGFWFTPLLLAGPPGVGKTHYVRRLGRILNTHCEFIAGANAMELKINLSGLNPSWKNAREGQVVRALLESKTASPLIVVDEIDKIGDANRSNHPTDCLLALLEPENAKAWIDEYLETPLRADRILWLLTANDLTGLPRPLLDRVVIVEIGAPDAKAVRRMAQDIYTELNRTAGSPLPAKLPDDTLDHLANETPRALRKVLDLAIGVAVKNKNDQMKLSDLLAAKEIAGKENERSGKIGFIRD